jgi:hypothetical protein
MFPPPLKKTIELRGLICPVEGLIASSVGPYQYSYPLNVKSILYSPESGMI